MDTNHSGIICPKCKFSSPIFKSLDLDQLKFLQDISYEVTFQSGETIFKQGTALTHIICISSGSSKLYVEYTNNKRLNINLLLPSDIAGVSGINTDFKHHFSLSAIEATTTCFIEVSAFLKIIHQNVGFANATIGYINMKHNRLYDKLMSLTQKNLNGKVAEMLLYLSKEVYGSSKFEAKLSRQDFADMAVASRESITRIFKDFKEQNIIECKENHFEIIQPDLLEKISNFG